MPSDPTRTLLVLGGSGFLGAHAVARALCTDTAASVWSASREPELPTSIVPRVARTRRLDALRDGEAERLCDEIAPARILLCTALSRIDECAAYPGLATALNTELPRRVARWCADRGTRLVFVSTDLVFGAQAPPATGFREQDLPAPVSVYGRSKAAGEQAVLATCPDALVVRLPLLYGPSGERGLGASDSLLRALAAGERPLLFEDEWRTPLDVRDAADALVEVLDGDKRGILHVAGPERLSRADLAVAVLAARGIERGEALSRIRLGTRAEAGVEADRPADVSLDASRARATLATRLRAASEALAQEDRAERARP